MALHEGPQTGQPLAFQPQLQGAAAAPNEQQPAQQPMGVRMPPVRQQQQQQQQQQQRERQQQGPLQQYPQRPQGQPQQQQGGPGVMSSLFNGGQMFPGVQQQPHQQASSPTKPESGNFAMDLYSNIAGGLGLGGLGAEQIINQAMPETPKQPPQAAQQPPPSPQQMQQQQMVEPPPEDDGGYYLVPGPNGGQIRLTPEEFEIWYPQYLQQMPMPQRQPRPVAMPQQQQQQQPLPPMRQPQMPNQPTRQIQQPQMPVQPSGPRNQPQMPMQQPPQMVMSQPAVAMQQQPAPQRQPQEFQKQPAQRQMAIQPMPMSIQPLPLLAMQQQQQQQPLMAMAIPQNAEQARVLVQQQQPQQFEQQPQQFPHQPQNTDHLYLKPITTEASENIAVPAVPPGMTYVSPNADMPPGYVVPNEPVYIVPVNENPTSPPIQFIPGRQSSSGVFVPVGNVEPNQQTEQQLQQLKPQVIRPDGRVMMIPVQTEDGRTRFVNAQLVSQQPSQ